jgi:3-phenylpropionate/trans-cinnamate dioxygenase ferredoxin reductase subunit
MRAKKLGANFPSDIYYLRSLSETLELSDAIQNVESVCIIGSGILGLEMASTLSELGKTVTVVGDSMASVVNNFGAEIAQAITADLENSGVKIIIDIPPKGARKVGAKYVIEQASGVELEADLLVAAVGSDINDEWLESSSLASGFGVWADFNGRVSEDIFAIGDVANWSESPAIFTRHPKTQMSAINQARTVARQIVSGEPLQWPAPLFWTELLKQKIQVFGEAAEQCEPVISSERGGKVSIHRRGSKVVGITAVAMPKEFTKTRAKYETEINQAWRS